MDYIDKLEGGQPISKVFPSCRKTTYRNLYIVSSKGKEALFHYSDENKVLLSAWYDHIDEFDNFIYTKVYFKDKFNYIYPTGKLVSPYWSDEMSRMSQVLWPISFNGMYNFIKDDGSLLLRDFAKDMWAESNSFIIEIANSGLLYPRDSYYCLTSDGKTQLLERFKCDSIIVLELTPDDKLDFFETSKGNVENAKNIVVDMYSSKLRLTEDLLLYRRLFSLIIEDDNGKELISDIIGVVKYNVRPICDFAGVTEGEQGILFSFRKMMLAGNEELLLFYDFVSIRVKDGYRILSLLTGAILPDTFEDVQVLDSVFIKVRKDGLWNIIDKYGDYVSKELWFDSIELMNSGNSIVRKGEQYNFLKSNGILLSSGWYDEIVPTIEQDKFVVRQGDMCNMIDGNLLFLKRKWQGPTESSLLLLSEKPKDLASQLHKQWSTIRKNDSVWIGNDGIIIQTYVLACQKNELTIIWSINEKGKVEVKILRLSFMGDDMDCYDSFQTSIGTLYINKPN